MAATFCADVSGRSGLWPTRFLARPVVQRRTPASSSGGDRLEALGVVLDGREDVVDLVGDAVTTLVRGPSVGREPVAADRAQ
jgi:hypothetical protein